MSGPLAADPRRRDDAFKTRTRDEWTKIFRDADVCVYPVLSLGEVADYPLISERHGFVTVDGIPQPAPAPRFDRTPPGRVRPATSAPADGFELGELGHPVAAPFPPDAALLEPAEGAA